MSEQGLDYQQMIVDALRGMVRRVLTEVSEHGLPGEHHFFINVHVDEPGVEIPAFLRQQYPKELPIVLQHRFEGLVVDETAFSVTLWFGGAAHRVTIPFRAVASFQDPSVPFGIQLSTPTSESPSATAEASASDPIDVTSKAKKEEEPAVPSSNVLSFERRES